MAGPSPPCQSVSLLVTCAHSNLCRTIRQLPVIQPVRGNPGLFGSHSVTVRPTLLAADLGLLHQPADLETTNLLAFGPQVLSDT